MTVCEAENRLGVRGKGDSSVPHRPGRGEAFLFQVLGHEEKNIREEKNITARGESSLMVSFDRRIAGGFRPAWLRMAAAVFVGIASCGGCTKAGPTERTVPVTGKVTLDGQSLTSGGVMFAPDREKGNQSALEMYGEIDSAGNYKVVAGVGDKKREGAALGWYRVVVEAYEMPKATKGGAESYGSESPPRLITPEKYTDPKASPLTVEVVENAAPGAYDLKLKK